MLTTCKDVVTDLILPRMAALAQLDGLDATQREQLFRMVEFIRHRWRGYVSDLGEVNIVWQPCTGLWGLSSFDSVLHQVAGGKSRVAAN